MTTEFKIEFVSGEDGHYKKVTNPLFEAMVKVDKNPDMPSLENSLTYCAKKIPGPVFRSWQSFCQEVSDKYRGSEAALILAYHPKHETWNAFPPVQDLSQVHADFTGVTEAVQKFREKHGKDWLIAGTLHSHPGGSYPSTTDVNDEKEMDGVHLIIPDFGKHRDDGITAHVSCSKVRFTVKEVGGFLIDFSVKGVNAHPAEWILQCKTGTGNTKKYKSVGGGYGGYHGYDHFGSGSELDYRGGPHRFDAKVGSLEINVMSESFDDPDIKFILKKLGIPKGERRFLIKNFGDDLDDLKDVFKEAREALKYQKEIKGDPSKYERERMIDDIGRCVESSLTAIKFISTRIIEQASKASREVALEIKGNGGGKKGEEEDDPKEDGESDTTVTRDDVPVDRVSHQDGSFPQTDL